MDAAGLVDFDDLGFLDGLECFDLDLPGGVDSSLAGPGKEGGLGLDLGSHDDGGRESSPDSVVTDDGEMSDFVSELERFLMEDVDDDEDSFLSDYFVADDGCAGPAAGAGVNDAETTGAEEDKELSTDDYFLDGYYVADDGCAEPAAGAAVEDAVSRGAKEEEEFATDGYFFSDYYVADDDRYAELAPGAGVVDPSSASLSEEEEEDGAAREDEATSRKRASIHAVRQRRCAASVPSEAELVLTRRGRCISVQLHGCHHRRLLCGSAWLST